LDSVELMMLAVYVKEAMQMQNYKIIDTEMYQSKMSNLKSSLPHAVMRLVWHGDSCRIRNKYWNEYLYADERTYDSKQRYVFSWIPKGTRDEDVWAFRTVANGETFTIVNKHHNEYLYSLEDEYNSERRYAFTWIPGTTLYKNFFWE